MIETADNFVRYFTSYIYKEKHGLFVKKLHFWLAVSKLDVSILIALFSKNIVSSGAQQLPLKYTVTKLWRRN